MHQASTNPRKTTLRKLVDARLIEHSTILSAFVEAGLNRGDSWADLNFALRQMTGIPISSRTLQRWFEEPSIEGAA